MAEETEKSKLELAVELLNRHEVEFMAALFQLEAIKRIRDEEK